MQARGALAKPTARSSLTNVSGFFIGFWERRRHECHLTHDVKLRARYIVGWNRPWGLDFRNMSTASSAPGSQPLASASISSPADAFLKERGRRLFEFEVRHG
jgi:hypothetical protein